LGKRKRQVEGGGPVHVNGVQVASELCISVRHSGAREECAGCSGNAGRDDAAAPASRWLSGRDVLEIDDSVGHAAVGSNDQAIEANRFLAVGLADLRILGDGEIQLARELVPTTLMVPEMVPPSVTGMTL
jgi:hypothetical protein